MEIKHSVILSLGSNLGDARNNILDAYTSIEAVIGAIINKSDFLINEAVGFKSETLFVNSCIEIETTFSPQDVLLATQKIEKQLGRLEKSIDQQYSSRIIDIDIILFDDILLKTNSLIIPHPLFKERTFVLIPLNQIAPNRIDPNTQLTVNQILKSNTNTFS